MQNNTTKKHLKTNKMKKILGFILEWFLKRFDDWNKDFKNGGI
jgi:hypothetical protein